MKTRLRPKSRSRLPAIGTREQDEDEADDHEDVHEAR